ncbi:MAG TPA: hypothetical protein VHN80_00860, partial [Kineosporiaceae bacterium]|nr:hypothetical protein [Kineosporiaceae bacterium]
AMVHYGVTMGDGAVLAPDSFLMKGEEMPPGAYWGGNPAGELRDNLAQALARPVTGGSHTGTGSNIGSGSNSSSGNSSSGNDVSNGSAALVGAE